jgi:hypothetical protein
MKTMTLADLQLLPTGRTIPVMGQSAAKVGHLRGSAELFGVRSPTWQLTIAHCQWDNGDQDVRLHSRGNAPQCFDRFRSTGRLGINRGRIGEFFVELMQTRMGENDHPRLRKVELEELSQGAGCDVRTVLTEMGAKVGTRESLIGDTGSHRSRYCATFARNAVEVAAVAYVLVRVAPFHRRIRV